MKYTCLLTSENVISRAFYCSAYMTYLYMHWLHYCILHYSVYMSVCVCLGVLGDQCLAVCVMSVRGKKLPTHVDRLPLSPKSTLSSVGSALALFSLYVI